MELAQYQLEQLPAVEEGEVRNRVVIMYTDGEPNHGNGFSGNVANSTIGAAKTMKGAGTKIYTIGTFGNDVSDTSNVVRYLNAVSSNFPKANGYTRATMGESESDDYYYNVKATPHNSRLAP